MDASSGQSWSGGEGVEGGITKETDQSGGDLAEKSGHAGDLSASSSIHVGDSADEWRDTASEVANEIMKGNGVKIALFLQSAALVAEAVPVDAPTGQGCGWRAEKLRCDAEKVVKTQGTKSAIKRSFIRTAENLNFSRSEAEASLFIMFLYPNFTFESCVIFIPFRMPLIAL